MTRISWRPAFGLEAPINLNYTSISICELLEEGRAEIYQCIIVRCACNRPIIQDVTHLDCNLYRNHQHHTDPRLVRGLSFR